MIKPVVFSVPLTSSLRARMTLAFAAWSTVITLLACVFFITWSRRVARNDVQERVSAAARLVRQEWESASTKKNAAKAIREAKEDMRLDNIALFIMDAAGNVLGANRASPLSVAEMRRHGWLTAEARSGDVTIIAGVDWQASEAAIGKQALLLYVFALLISIAGGIGAWFLVGSTLRPIGILADEAGFASADPLRARLHAPSGDAEVQHLVKTLNGFLERFQESTRAREQFYAAAAHELRTPLSVLSGNIEVALSRPRTVTDHEETLRELQTETRRLIALAEGLLTLNRLQTNSNAEEPEAVNIADECEQILDRLQLLACERHLKATFGGETEAGVFAPRSHVVMLLRNLLENAVKYAPTGGSVNIRVWCQEGTVRMTVYNQYENAENLPLRQIYEPFFRADPSRSVSTGGNGLGLAICRRLADTHGWHLQHTATDTGIAANVAFPAIQ